MNNNMKKTTSYLYCVNNLPDEILSILNLHRAYF